MRNRVRGVLSAVAIGVCLLAASPPRSHAGFTIADWQATPSQTIGDTTWILAGTDLPTTLNVEFLSSADKRIQNELGLPFGPGTYTLDYTVSLSDGNGFTGLVVDSKTFGLSEITKVINGLVSAKSVDGYPSLPTSISGSPSSLTVHETISIPPGSLITALNDVYFVTPLTAQVPDSTSSAALLLISVPLLWIGQFRSRMSTP